MHTHCMCKNTTWIFGESGTGKTMLARSQTKEFNYADTLFLDSDQFLVIALDACMKNDSSELVHSFAQKLLIIDNLDTLKDRTEIQKLLGLVIEQRIKENKRTILVSILSPSKFFILNNFFPFIKPIELIATNERKRKVAQSLTAGKISPQLIQDIVISSKNFFEIRGKVNRLFCISKY